jgi:hypothetical protein
MPAHSQAAVEAHHVVKLALMTVRLLDDIEQIRGTGHAIEEIIAARVRDDAVREPVSLLHQATFLQFGYVSLVWLRESVRAHLPREAQEAAEDSFKRRLSSVPIPKGNGPRTIDSWSAVVRLVRNAISHARVETDEQHFTFTDHDKRNEHGPTSITMTWGLLGQMSEAYLWAVQDVLF